jgi:hypothetical protein
MKKINANLAEIANCKNKQTGIKSSRSNKKKEVL